MGKQSSTFKKFVLGVNVDLGNALYVSECVSRLSHAGFAWCPDSNLPAFGTNHWLI